MTQKYLIDSNCFISAKNVSYPFDIAPGFWRQLRKHIISGNILVHEAVYQELVSQKDDLSDWIKGLSLKNRVDIRDIDTSINYGKVLDYVANSGFYKPEALANWAAKSTADPQLIASAMTHQYTVVTHETQNKGLQRRNKSKNAKIPDVAANFNVRTIPLIQMMRELHFRL